MKVTVIPGRIFVKRVKQLAKKYPSIVLDLRKLEAELIENPKMGVDLGGGFTKDTHEYYFKK